MSFFFINSDTSVVCYVLHFAGSQEQDLNSTPFQSHALTWRFEVQRWTFKDDSPYHLGDSVVVKFLFVAIETFGCFAQLREALLFLHFLCTVRAFGCFAPLGVRRASPPGDARCDVLRTEERHRARREGAYAWRVPGAGQGCVRDRRHRAHGVGSFGRDTGGWRGHHTHSLHTRTTPPHTQLARV